MTGKTANPISDTNVFHRDLGNIPPAVSHAEGVHVWDSDGKKYLDASSGGNVVISVGYGVDEVIDAMTEQAKKVAFCGAFTSEPQERLARQLADFAPEGLNRVRFVSGGSEANETAIKLARHYFVEAGNPEKYKIVGRWRSYHGNTLGALSATGHVLRRKNYLPMLLPFPHTAPPYRYRCQFCSEKPACSMQCADDIERTILNEGPDSVAAFIAEPVVGAAAMGMIADQGYFARVREICDKYDVLLIVDEVLSGMGRTGKNFAIEHWDTIPDIITCGKGISSGYTPLGAVITTDEIYETVRDGTGAFEHGFTYGGNPLSCAVGSAVLTYLRENSLVENAASVGGYLQEQVKHEVEELDIVGEISGLGMICGIEIVADKVTKEPFDPTLQVANRIAQRCKELGVLINPSFSGNVDGYRGDRFGICPPLTFSKNDVDRTVEALGRAVRDIRIQLKQ